MSVRDALGVTPTPDTGERLSAVRLWDESSRPAGPEPPHDAAYSSHGRAIAGHLVEIHDHLRAELARIRDLIGQVRDGASAALVRSAINQMTVRQNSWTLGAYCAAYCRTVIWLIAERTSAALAPSLTWPMRSRIRASSARRWSCISTRWPAMARPCEE